MGSDLARDSREISPEETMYNYHSEKGTGNACKRLLFMDKASRAAVACARLVEMDYTRPD